MIASPRVVAEVDALAAEINEFCAAHADPAVVAKYAHYFTEGYDPYGVASDVLTAQRRLWLAAHRATLGQPGFLDLADRLWAGGKYEPGFLAIYFVGAFKREFSPETFERVGAWFAHGVWNWAHCDSLCGDLLSAFLMQEIILLPGFAPWRESRYKYQRRAVPVAMLTLLKTADDVTPLLDFVRPLMTDPERVVHQGVGWFLREVWRRRPAPAEAFLLEWKDRSPRLIYQYATEKMVPADRARFRAETPRPPRRASRPPDPAPAPAPDGA